MDRKRASCFSLFLVLLLSSSSAQNTGKFAVLSDVHYDPTIGSNPPVPTDIKFGVDSPLWLVNSAVAAMGNSTLVPGTLDFILSSGDMMGHSLSSQTAANANTYAATVLTALNSSFYATFGSSNNPWLTNPVYALGNNDLYPKYAAPGATPGWFSLLASVIPSINNSQSAAQSFLINGSYTIDIPMGVGSANKVRMVVLHTNYWSISNTYTTNQSDPGGVFAFLEEALEQAKTDGVPVYILGHVAPGVDHYAGSSQWHPQFVTTYVSIVSPYLGTTIQAQFYGHEHVAIYRLLGNAVAPSVYAPIHLHTSISPVYSNNPSFRVYTYDRTNGQLLDFASWYLDFSNGANPVWLLQFPSAKALFSIPNIQSTGFCTLTQSMYANSSLTNSYVNNSYSFASDEPANCDATCQTNAICNTQFLTVGEMTACETNGTRLACAQAAGSTTGTPGASTGSPALSTTTHSSGFVLSPSMWGLILCMIVAALN